MSKFTSPTRRRFIRNTALAAAAAGLPEWLLGCQSAVKHEQAAQQEPRALSAQPTSAPTTQPKLPVALIGCGGRGVYVCEKEGPQHLQVVAVCDVDDKHAASAARKFKVSESNIYKDFRKVIERKDIKAVVNATPDHWHTLINIHALRQGKDVYGEKPLTLTIEEGQKVIQTVNETKGILQTGSQQRSDPKFRLACELVRNGRIGQLTHITTVVPTGAHAGPFSTPQEVPSHFDWEFWQGQTPRRDYLRERTHGLFRWWWDYSEGTITDWGAHHHDIALWAMGLDRAGPLSIDARGIGEPIKGGFTTFPSFYIEYVYPNGVTHTSIAVPQEDAPYATERLKPGFIEDQSTTKPSTQTTQASTRRRTESDKGWRNGVRFEGTAGWIEVARGRIDASRPEILHDPLPKDAIRLYKSDDHVGNFVQCVRTREQPIASAEIGHRSASLCHLGAISCRLDRKLFWNPATEEFTNDQAANAMRSRPMHDPWGYDKV